MSMVPRLSFYCETVCFLGQKVPPETGYQEEPRQVLETRGSYRMSFLVHMLLTAVAGATDGFEPTLGLQHDRVWQ